jgi:hypothetical protein
VAHFCTNPTLCVYIRDVPNSNLGEGIGKLEWRRSWCYSVSLANESNSKQATTVAFQIRTFSSCITDQQTLYGLQAASMPQL